MRSSSLQLFSRALTYSSRNMNARLSRTLHLELTGSIVYTFIRDINGVALARRCWSVLCGQPALSSCGFFRGTSAHENFMNGTALRSCGSPMVRATKSANRTFCTNGPVRDRRLPAVSLQRRRGCERARGGRRCRSAARGAGGVTETRRISELREAVCDGAPSRSGSIARSCTKV